MRQIKFLLSMGKKLFRMAPMKAKIELDRPIVMVGLMGAGKTSVGRALAHHLGVPFIDSDKEIERAAGCSVVDIFSLYGEKEFRRVERQVVDRLIDSPPRVKIISTGEGAFITPEIRQRVLQDAISIWLKADLDLLVKRTKFRDTRPQLLHNDSKKILAQLIAERYNTYAEANITVETFDESLHKTLAKVVDALNQHLNQKEQNNGK
jgi:shikimate kinase